MDTASRTEPRTGKTSANETRTSLIIAAPFYRNERLVDPFVRALMACAPEIRELNARVILFNDSPDYPALHARLEEAAATIGNAFRVSVIHNASNMGWLKTCNIAMREADQSGADVLLFNSDTIIFPGALLEMARVARLDPMIGFVNPRSNNATLATLPVGRTPAEDPADAHAQYLIAARTTPAITYVPTAVGFAVLIRHIILAEFGYFDEVYGGGYNEENDLVMRASRCGYRAVLANHAFVWHEGEASLGATENSSALRDLPNRKILVRRYPEYTRIVDGWFNSDEYITEQLLSALVAGPDGRLTVALDFSSFGNFHSGTFKAGLQFLKHAHVWKKKFNVVVLCAPDTYQFHDMAATGVPRADAHDQKRYAALFRVGQPFDWHSAQRMSVKGAVIGTFMLDTIAIDCGHLFDPSVFGLWQHVINHSDFITYNSAFTARQFATRFANVERRPSIVSLHSIEPADYAPATGEPSEAVRNMPKGHILVVGNQYPHKTVGDAANRIASAYPERRVFALGVTKARPDLQGAPPGVPSPVGPQNAQLLNLPNLDGLTVGELSDEDVTALQSKASVIVMPSHYEGFGMPILMALVLKKPVFARRIPPVQEIHQQLGHDPNVHLFDTTADLVRMLETPPDWMERPDVEKLKTDGDRLAADVLDIMERCIASATYSQILERVRATNNVFNASSKLTPAIEGSGNNADVAAHKIGRATERVFRPLLRLPLMYKAFRGVYHVARFTRSKLNR